MALTHHMPAVAADITWTLYYLGWRISEVLGLTDLATAMELTGHKSLSVALRYQIADLARQRAGLERLEAHRKTIETRGGRA